MGDQAVLPHLRLVDQERGVLPPHVAPGTLVGEAAPGVPTISPVSAEQTREFLVSTAQALVVTT